MKTTWEQNYRFALSSVSFVGLVVGAVGFVVVAVCIADLMREASEYPKKAETGGRFIFTAPGGVTMVPIQVGNINLVLCGNLRNLAGI